MKTGALDLIHEHKIGTEIFVTMATLIAMLGREYVAGAVLMTIILIVEFIAEFNTDQGTCVDQGADRQCARCRDGATQWRVRECAGHRREGR